MRFYALEILRIGLGFTGRFPYAEGLQILLQKTSPKQASEEGRIMTDQTLGRSNSGPVRLPVHDVEYEKDVAVPTPPTPKAKAQVQPQPNLTMSEVLSSLSI